MIKIYSKNQIQCFIWLHQVLTAACKLLVAACGIQFPDQELNPGPLPWEHVVLTTVPPEKSPRFNILVGVFFIFFLPQDYDQYKFKKNLCNSKVSCLKHLVYSFLLFLFLQIGVKMIFILVVEESNPMS